MLRKIRIVAAALFFAAITLLFLDFTGTVHAWLGWMAKVQLLPAVLALNVGVVAALVVLTLLLGRVYCSVICPLGVMQDIVSWVSGRRKKKKYRFSYSPEVRRLRYGVLVIFLGALAAGVSSIVALLAPYSSYGRIVSSLFAPIYQWGNNLLALAAERADSYAFYETEVWMKGLVTLVVAVVTFVMLAVLAWRNGRTYCNAVCPVGTVLGLLSRYSLLKPVIDTEKCNGCGLCARGCKASCINPKEHEIDYSRCVACMDCIENCRNGAIKYVLRRGGSKPAADADTSRRGFITASALLAAGAIAKAQEKKVDGGLATIVDKKRPVRQTPLAPPGAVSLRNFAQHCTSCQLCVSVCPNKVLRPSSSLENLMQPEMSYEWGYCRPECTKCGDVCPAGAIRPLSVEDKSAVQIGHAVWVSKNCVPLADGKSCDNCARHCPVGAIEMIPIDPDDRKSLKVPAINTALCIGCGACENLCPARPFSAIYVEGHEVHSTI